MRIIKTTKVGETKTGLDYIWNFPQKSNSWSEQNVCIMTSINTHLNTPKYPKHISQSAETVRALYARTTSCEQLLQQLP